MPRALLSLVVMIVLVAPAEAKTWFVRGPGADFDEIQPAIDVAQDGDVILVRPGGVFANFTLTKGVMIRASEGQFAMAPKVMVHVRGVELGKRAGISGISLSTSTAYVYTGIEVHDCQGEVVLESISLQASDHRSSYLRIVNSANVSVTSLQTSSGSISILDHSHVRLSDVSVSVGYPDDCTLDAGVDAIYVASSSVVIADATLRGGDGCPGDWVFTFPYAGGPGGDGLRARNSDIVIVGNYHVFAGGNGGDGLRDQYGHYISAGGDGGNGFEGTEGASAVASRMTFMAGGRGFGNPNGHDGAPWVGTLTENDVIPSLSMSGDLNPGEIFLVRLDVVEAGGILVVFADHQGFLAFPGNEGPPLGAIPGGRFLTFYAGHLDASGHLGLPLLLPNDPSLRGTPLNAQCAVLLDAGGFILSNAMTRVIGE